MKTIQVTINKNRTEDKTEFIYPILYDANKFEIIVYENKGGKKEYAIALTDDEFTDSEGLKEITKQNAETLIEKYIKEDKDLKDKELAKIGKNKEDFILKRKELLGK